MRRICRRVARLSDPLVLLFLIENRGRLVEKTQILDAVWKETFVSENALTRVIAQLRKALSDESNEITAKHRVCFKGFTLSSSGVHGSDRSLYARGWDFFTRSQPRARKCIDPRESRLHARG